MYPQTLIRTAPARRASSVPRRPGILRPGGGASAVGAVMTGNVASVGAYVLYVGFGGVGVVWREGCAGCGTGDRWVEAGRVRWSCAYDRVS